MKQEGGGVVRLQQWLYRLGIGVLIVSALIAGVGRYAAPQGVPPAVGTTETAALSPSATIDAGESRRASGSPAEPDSPEASGVEEPDSEEASTPESERRQVDLDALRESMAARNVISAGGVEESSWQTEITFANRGSIRLGYTANEGEFGMPAERIDAEIEYQVFGPASLLAGYRLFNFRDVNGLEAARDALARAELQVRF